MEKIGEVEVTAVPLPIPTYARWLNSVKGPNHLQSGRRLDMSDPGGAPSANPRALLGTTGGEDLKTMKAATRQINPKLKKTEP